MRRALHHEVLVSLLVLATALTVVLAAGEKVKLSGYAEYRKGDTLIVDGQRVRTDGKTKYKGHGIYSVEMISLGYEVKVQGRRGPDGVVLAERVEARPNGVSMFEPEVLQATNQIEQTWVKEGKMFSEDSAGKRVDIGKLAGSGPQVDRVRRIMNRLIPPYIDRRNLRVRVVETKEWNASAMGNGAIWVYSGLLDQMSDDELAVILGHELAHYTHEHSRKGAKRGMILQMLSVGALVGASSVGGTAGQAAGIGGLLGLTAFQSGYSRDMEDQADRVGLRYAYEGGFDVRQAPRLWERFREKYGEQDSVSNFFVGSHSRPSDRIRNLQHELAVNY